jgi:ribonucleoside-diphosphate reductase alpha chain
MRGANRGVAMTRRARLPNRRGSCIVAFQHNGHRYRASGSFFPHTGGLAEIFLDVGKAGSAVQQQADDAAVLASLLLQHGVSVRTIRQSITGPIAEALNLLTGEVAA